METKYRDIADGNSTAVVGTGSKTTGLETKYRDIADGNRSYLPLVHTATGLETKYRDIADGN